jgi:hypothetical protein
MKETVAVSIIMVSTVIHLVHLQSLVEEVDMTMDQTFMLQVARTRLLQKLGKRIEEHQQYFLEGSSHNHQRIYCQVHTFLY